MVVGLVCVSCARRFEAVPGHEMTCPTCGPDKGTLDYLYDLDTLRHRWVRPLGARGLETWLPLLPVAPAALPAMPVGPTPLIDAPRLARHLGVRALRLKLDGLLPSLSLKDRASAVALAQARLWDREIVVAASTGNAASSLATLAAFTGQRAVLLVPRGAPAGKLAQIALHGGILIPVDGTYDQAFDLSTEVAAHQGWYLRSTAVNPVLSEGKKTAALEAALQLDWEIGDLWSVSVGDGCIFGSLWKGLSELHALGWISEVPPLMGVQAQGAAPLARAWSEGRSHVEPWPSTATCADSIAVGHPRDWVKALRAALSSGGGIIQVPDELIVDAMRLLAQQAGVLAEPAGAASLAGVMAMAANGQIGIADRVIVLITGHGLKDASALTRTFAMPGAVEVSVEAVSDAALQALRQRRA